MKIYIFFYYLLLFLLILEFIFLFIRLELLFLLLVRSFKLIFFVGFIVFVSFRKYRDQNLLIFYICEHLRDFLILHSKLLQLIFLKSILFVNCGFQFVIQEYFRPNYIIINIFIIKNLIYHPSQPVDFILKITYFL